MKHTRIAGSTYALKKVVDDVLASAKNTGVLSRFTMLELLGLTKQTCANAYDLHYRMTEAQSTNDAFLICEDRLKTVKRQIDLWYNYSKKVTEMQNNFQKLNDTERVKKYEIVRYRIDEVIRSCENLENTLKTILEYQKK